MTKFNSTPTTPQEIDDYKKTWYPGYAVNYHTDLKYEAKNWVKEHVRQYSYKHHTYTDVYQHTYHFENHLDANDFEALFGIDG